MLNLEISCQSITQPKPANWSFILSKGGCIAAKLAKKKVDDDTCASQIEHNIKLKTFRPLSTLQVSQ
jgi:hypothetical protein